MEGREQSAQPELGRSGFSVPAPPAQQSSPRWGGNVPKGKVPCSSPHQCPRGMAMGGPASEPPGHAPQGKNPFGEAGVHCQAPTQHPPYLQDVACCFPGNGDGIPHTSGSVSLHPLRCRPCFPGNPASGSSGRQVPGVPSRLPLCPATRHLAALLWGPWWPWVGGQARCWQVWGSRQPCLSRQSSAHALLTAGARGSAGCGEPWAARGWEEKRGLGTLCLHKGPGTGLAFPGGQ